MRHHSPRTPSSAGRARSARRHRTARHAGCGCLRRSRPPRSTALVLLAAEHDLPGLLVGLVVDPAAVGEHLNAALDRRTFGDLVEPAHEIGILAALHALAVREAGPG